MLQQENFDNYVLATGETHTVRKFVEKAFELENIEIRWIRKRGTVNEIGLNATDEYQVLVKIDA